MSLPPSINTTVHVGVRDSVKRLVPVRAVGGTADHNYLPNTRNERFLDSELSFLFPPSLLLFRARNGFQILQSARGNMPRQIKLERFAYLFTKR
jgi:hypothetical protein